MTGGVLALAALVALQAGAPQASWPSVRGTVVDAKTNQPIVDARVTLVEPALSTRTGPDGRFEFVRVEPKPYTLTVSTIGYSFVRRRVVVVANTDLDVTVPIAEGTGAYQETVTVTRDEAAQTKALGVTIGLNRRDPSGRPDWSGCQIIDGLNRAADSSAYSWLK